jgi:hypothetical protein
MHDLGVLYGKLIWVMLLSEMTFNAGSVPWHVLVGWVLLALAL